MNKRISIVCLLLGMATIPFSADAQRRRRSGTTGQTGAVRTKVSSGLIAGYNANNKLFKNTSITLAEKRSVDFLPLLDKESSVYSKVIGGQYEICIPCADIVLEKAKDNQLSEVKKTTNKCYTLTETDVTYTLATKEGAINTCASKVRMTLNDMRSAAKTEVDSVVLNIVPASSAYDYAGVKLGDDPEIKDLINNYETAKEEAKEKCSKDEIMKTLEGIRGAMIGGTVGSGIAIATGGVDTALQITDVVQTANAKKAHQAQLDQFDKEIAGIDEDIADIEKIRNRLDLEEDENLQTLGQLEDDYDSVEKKYSDKDMELTREYDVLVAQRKSLKKEKEKLDDYTKEQQEELSKAYADVVKEQGDVDALQKELEALTVDTEAYNTKKAELTSAKGKLTSAETKLKELEGEENVGLMKQIADLEGKLAELNVNILQLESEWKSLNNRKADIVKRQNFSSQRGEELRADISEKRSEKQLLVDQKNTKVNERKNYNDTWEEKNKKGKPDALDIASGALGVVSGVGNATSAVTAGVSAGLLNDLITQLSDCKKAVKVMQNAGIDLENGLADLMSADVSNNENQTKTDE